MKDVECHVCNEIFQISFRNHGITIENNKIYLCPSCINVDVNCKECGKVFRAKFIKSKEAKFCSQNCSRKNAIKAMSIKAKFDNDLKYCEICDMDTKRYKNGACVRCITTNARAGDHIKYCEICKLDKYHYKNGKCMSCVKKLEFIETVCSSCGEIMHEGKECRNCKTIAKAISINKNRIGAKNLVEIKSIKGAIIKEAYTIANNKINLITIPLPDYNNYKILYPSNDGICSKCGREYKGIAANQKYCTFCFEFASCSYCGVDFIPRDGIFYDNSGLFCSRSCTVSYSHRNKLINYNAISRNNHIFVKDINNAIKFLGINIESIPKFANIIIDNPEDIDTYTADIQDKAINWQIMSNGAVIYSAQTIRAFNEIKDIEAILNGSWNIDRNSRKLIMEYSDLSIRISHIDVCNADMRMSIESVYDAIAKVKVSNIDTENIDINRVISIVEGNSKKTSQKL